MPDAPAAPVFVSATQDEVTLQLFESLNDNGVSIAGYELYIDAGDDTLSDFTLAKSFSGYTEIVTLTQADDGLGGPGTIYRVKTRAVNEDSYYSDYSNELIFELGPLP